MISVSKNITEGFIRQTGDLDSIAKIIRSNNWSCGHFKGGYRNNQNFVEAYTIAIDVDNDSEHKMTLEEAKAKLKGIQSILSTTKSHQIKKGGRPPCDRFRILLFLEEPIKNQQDYLATWEEARKLFPAADAQCKDPARFYYPSKAIVSKTKGRRFPVKKYSPPEPKAPKSDSTIKGILSQATLEFICKGAPEGQWNARFTKAVIDLREQLYSKEEASEMLALACRKYEGQLTDGDLASLESVYRKELRYESRGGISYNFMSVSDLRKTSKAYSWLVDGLIFEGSLNILTGPPKAGKSCIIRQLLISIVHGAPFLNRDIKRPGPTLYIALEDHAAQLAQDLKTMGLKDNDPLKIHSGPVKGEQYITQLQDYLTNNDTCLVAIDTLALFARITNLNDYAEVNEKMQRIREVARNTNTAIMLVHHSNKSDNMDSRAIAGSQAIFGAVDCSILFFAKETDRYLESVQRGGTPIKRTPMTFNEKTLTYSFSGDASEF